MEKGKKETKPKSMKKKLDKLEKLEAKQNMTRPSSKDMLETNKAFRAKLSNLEGQDWRWFTKDRRSGLPGKETLLRLGAPWATKESIKADVSNCGSLVRLFHYPCEPLVRTFL